MYSKKEMIFYIIIFYISIAVFMSQIFIELDPLLQEMALFWFFISIIKVIRYKRYQKDREYADKINAENDERETYILTKAESYTFRVVLIILYPTVYILHFMGFREAEITCVCVSAAMVIIYWITYVLVRHRN